MSNKKNESVMVVATKYRLTKYKSLKEGTWDKTSREEVGLTNVIKRSYVIERNSHENNEIYVIDEEATVRAMEQRDINIKAMAAKKKKDSSSSKHDVVDAIKDMSDAIKDAVSAKVPSPKLETSKSTKK